uniref:BEN domain-containing protein n=1 Tax=Trichobilharzia regenti TaxID=157069 RepID=A0AA85K2Z9_TRIRE|nr:unnamed protein product [Trichobilharzia regenti]
MPRGVMIRTMHQINDLNDSYTDSKYDISDEQYYYGTNKRKRKTAAPQKREMSEEACEEDVKRLLKSPSFGPINLVSKESNSFNSPLNTTDNSISISRDDAVNTSSEHIRLYAAMLNYFLMKYRSPLDYKSGSLPTYPPTTENNHSFEKTSISTFQNSLSELFCATHTQQNTNPLSVTHNEQCQINGSHNDDSYYNPKDFDGLYKNIISKYSAYMDWRQSIMNSISTCITNIPVPKSGFPNYEAMSACYKSLLDRAYALQQSVELYFRMIQNCLSYDQLHGSNFNGVGINSPVRNAVWSGQTSSMNNLSTQSSYPPSSYSTVNLSAVLTDILQSTNSALNSQDFSSEYKQPTGTVFDHCNQSSGTYIPVCQTQNILQSPVDLTNSDRYKTVTTCLSAMMQENETKTQNSDKSNKENSYDYPCNNESDGCDVPRKSERNWIQSLDRDAEFTSSNSSSHEAIPDVDPRNGFINQTLKHSTSNMLCDSLITCSPRSNMNIKKKSYFKSKRVKKPFISTSQPNINNISAESSPKKSNFRGTSEEENKVAPNFKPIEVNSQILLSEAHPNVKLSKDIFYSLIVKSSGSATRLIRLLMKSFFTQDELAASSLSGEGIYKQRLEPSVTEAIKIFIRQRHPQLKTGSINLCMTDVCVQARRVANNQRSRQHPLRISPCRQDESIKSQGNNSSNANNINNQNECDNSLIGVKSRLHNSNRFNSTTKLSKHNHHPHPHHCHSDDLLTPTPTAEPTTTTTTAQPSPLPLTNEYDTNYSIEIPKTEINDLRLSESSEIDDEAILHVVDEGQDVVSDEIDTPASCSVHSFVSSEQK